MAMMRRKCPFWGMCRFITPAWFLPSCCRGVKREMWRREAGRGVGLMGRCRPGEGLVLVMLVLVVVLVSSVVGVVCVVAVFSQPLLAAGVGVAVVSSLSSSSPHAPGLVFCYFL